MKRRGFFGVLAGLVGLGVLGRKLTKRREPLVFTSSDPGRERLRLCADGRLIFYDDDGNVQFVLGDLQTRPEDRIKLHISGSATCINTDAPSQILHVRRS